ncbi:MAG: amidohydrolase family protein [Desulfurivibrionaceae bacterium]
MNCIKAETIYTGTSVLKDSYLLFDGKKITGISDTEEGKLQGSYEVVTPAFIDPHSHISLVRSGEPESEEEANDNQDPIIALADALDSVQMDDMALRDAVEMGVLYSCILPGSGNIIGGLSAVIRNYASNSSQALVMRSGVKAAFGYNPMSTQNWKGTRPSTRMGAIAILRKKLDEVLQKEERWEKATGEKKEEITFSAEEKVLREILNKKTALRIHVHKTDDIAALLRLVDEFGIRVTVEHAMDVNQPEIFRELKERGITVIYGPVDAFAYKVELKHENWRNIKYLIESGVDFGIMSDHPVTPARQLFLQGRWLLRAGYTKQQVVEIFSRKNAELLGLNQVAGSLEPYKWASFTCWSGDPFDLASYPVAVYGEGRVLFSEEEKSA